MRRNFGGPATTTEFPCFPWVPPVACSCCAAAVQLHSSCCLRKPSPLVASGEKRHVSRLGVTMGCKEDQGSTASRTSKHTFNLRPVPSTWWKRASNLVQENIKHIENVCLILVLRWLVAQLSQHFAAAISRRPARAGAVLRILCMRKQQSFPQLQTLGFHTKLQGIAVLLPLQGWRTCQPSLWRSWPAHESHDNLDNLDIRAWNYVNWQEAEPRGPTRQVQWDFRPLSVECSRSPLSCAWRTWAPPLHPQVTSFMISILIILTQADWCEKAASFWYDQWPTESWSFWMSKTFKSSASTVLPNLDPFLPSGNLT